MLGITIGLIFILIGVEFLFFAGRLQCDADNACKQDKSWYRPLSEWLRDPRRTIPLRIAGFLCLMIAVYFFSLAR